MTEISLSKTIQKLIKKERNTHTHTHFRKTQDSARKLPECIKCCAKSMNIRPFANLIISRYTSCWRWCRRCHCSQNTRARNQCTSTWITHIHNGWCGDTRRNYSIPIVCRITRSSHHNNSRKKTTQKIFHGPSIQIALHKWRKCVLLCALFSHF